MTITRKFTAATVAALLAGTGVAAAAEAPVVSIQHTSPTETAPVTIPGTGVHKGERLPGGARLVYRNVALEGEQSATFNIKAPSGKRLRGVVPQNDQLGFEVVSRPDYGGRTKVQIRAFANPQADGRVEGRIYGLVR